MGIPPRECEFLWEFLPVSVSSCWNSSPWVQSVGNHGLASPTPAWCWARLPWHCPHTVSAAPAVNPPGAVTNPCPRRGGRARAVAPLPLALVLTFEKGQSGATVTPSLLLGLSLFPLGTSGVPSPVLGGSEGTWGTGGSWGWVSAGRDGASGLGCSDPGMSSAPGSCQALPEGEIPMLSGCCWSLVFTPRASSHSCCPRVSAPAPDSGLGGVDKGALGWPDPGLTRV